MDYFGLAYLSLFSLAWLFSLGEHIKHKEKFHIIILTFFVGVFAIISVTLTWPKLINPQIKEYWKYVLLYIILAEAVIIKYEIKILPERIEELEVDIEVDDAIKGFSIFIELLLIFPSLYYAYKVAFL